jgi:hypothetical protein
MDNKIRIVRKEEDLYRIDISDDGKEIVLDLADIALPLKINRVFNKAQNNINATNVKIKALEKRKDNDVMVGLMTKYERDLNQALVDMHKENRKIMDEVFGEGTILALFGKDDYIDMYDDLFELLQPHFEKIEINVEGIKNRLAKKYGKQDTTTLK